MKLLLTSVGICVKNTADFFLKILPKNPKECSVLMFACVEDDEDIFYVNEAKKELSDICISNITFFNLRDEKFIDQNKYDIIYICGGDTFLILDRMRKLGVDKFIIQSVKDNSSVYVGVSAGGILAGPDIEIAGWGSEGDINDINLMDLEGLNLTNIALFPHYKFHLKNEVDEFRKKVKYPVVEITDKQAFFVDNNGYKIIG